MSQSYPLIGNIIGFLRNRHRFHDWVTDMLSATPSLTLRVDGFLGLSRGVCTADPANVHHLLRSNFPNYIKGRRYTDVLHHLLGDGIFNSDGHLWSSQRKIASYEFNTKSLRSFISETVQTLINESLIPHLAAAADSGETLDLQQVLRKFGFDNICNVAFGVDPGFLRSSNSNHSKNISFVTAFEAAVDHAFSRFLSPLPVVWKLKRFFNIGSEREYKKSIETIDEFAMGVIESKETQTDSKTHEDLLSRFMVSSSDMGFVNDQERRKFLRDIIISFVLAGKDSTATALTWFFWFRPSSFTTLDPPRVFSNRPVKPNLRRLKEPKLPHAALSESMRLFPPVPINSRLTVNDDVLPDGTFVGKGWFADYSAYAMGRMERLWGSDCGEFKPERWLDENGVYRAVDQFKYPVFHGGFRMCLGKEMAYMQMKCVVVAIMCEFEVVVVDGGGRPEKMVDPPYTLSLLLGMKNGLPVKLKKRRH
ncbi:LOW QUALITY PROTEIN: hypothetical protein OSB04_030248 [Centaurea solstitialis]|uniref:Cytochrome P450 n=1 Tax=Centaurea solstitialis TaxID=347529 RepID=A0AA38W3M4_9ASTR|nr:LOW QUALITY PROTEIN: hypothetical protein OSB04_030248 [Centaurea solstitialis]